MKLKACADAQPCKRIWQSWIISHSQNSEILLWSFCCEANRDRFAKSPESSPSLFLTCSYLFWPCWVFVVARTSLIVAEGAAAPSHVGSVTGLNSCPVYREILNWTTRKVPQFYFSCKRGEVNILTKGIKWSNVFTSTILTVPGEQTGKR